MNWLTFGMAYLLPASLRPLPSVMDKLRSTASSYILVRTLSAQQSTDMVSQMVQFARATCQVGPWTMAASSSQQCRSLLSTALTVLSLQANPQQALDVLQTGLGHQAGAGRFRLHLAVAEVEAGRSNWVSTHPLCRPVDPRLNSSRVKECRLQLKNMQERLPL